MDRGWVSRIETLIRQLQGRVQSPATSVIDYGPFIVPIPAIAAHTGVAFVTFDSTVEPGSLSSVVFGGTPGASSTITWTWQYVAPNWQIGFYNAHTSAVAAAGNWTGWIRVAS
jgi:hypothetical protein